MHGPSACNICWFFDILNRDAPRYAPTSGCYRPTVIDLVETITTVRFGVNRF
jgi:hypothetical protein